MLVSEDLSDSGKSMSKMMLWTGRQRNTKAMRKTLHPHLHRLLEIIFVARLNCNGMFTKFGMRKLLKGWNWRN
jgi:hypothetical protein